MVSVLQIGTEPPLSTILDILRKGSYKKNEDENFKKQQTKRKWSYKQGKEHVAEDGIFTLLEKMSLFSRWEQRNEI